MNVQKVTLSTSPFEILNFDQDNIQLFLTGAALEEGAWVDMYGTPQYYPREVIWKYSEFFRGAPLCCEHGHEVGRILETRNTEYGFDIDAVVTHYDTILRILEGLFSGFSVGAVVAFNERRIAQEFIECSEISLVASPACKTCLIDSGYCTEDRIAMSNIEKQVDAFARLQKSAEEFKSATRSLSEVVLNSVDVDHAVDNNTTYVWSSIEGIKMSEEEKTAVAPVEEVVEETAPVEEVEETPAEETPVEEVVEETVAMSEFVALKEQLEAKDIQIAELTAKLSAFTTAAEKQIEAERAALMEGIMSIDPKADQEVLAGMTNVQLSAYKRTAEELAKPVVGATKKSDQEVKLSAPVKEESVSAILAYLRGQQH